MIKSNFSFAAELGYVLIWQRVRCVAIAVAFEDWVCV